MELHDSTACSVWGYLIRIGGNSCDGMSEGQMSGLRSWEMVCLFIYIHTCWLAKFIDFSLFRNPPAVSCKICCITLFSRREASARTWKPAPLSVGGMIICGGQSFDCVSSVHDRHIHWFEWGGLTIGIWARHADDHPARAGVGSSSLQLYLTKQIDLHMTIFHTLSIVLQSLFEWSSL
jgi:hypothetical protein